MMKTWFIQNRLGAEENNGKARKGPTYSALVPGEVSRAPWSEAPASRLLGEAWDLDSQRELAQTETAPTLACLAQGVTATIVHGVLLTARQDVSS